MLDATFQSNLKDPTVAVAIELQGSRSILIAFGGIAGALGIPPFEFFNSTRDLDVSRVYVRDLHQSWYHGGLPGLARDVEGVASYLQKVVRDSGADRVVMLGNSMGGFAAILFGALVGADEVHAFSPQTFIDAEGRKQHGDRRWEMELARVHRLGGPRFHDLVPLLTEYTGRCRFHVRFSPQDALDALHAERLRTFECVQLHAYPVGGHDLIRHLKSTGILEGVVAGALDPSSGFARDSAA